MIRLINDNPLDDKLVLMGMSCVGKTTFAGLLDRKHYSFDAQYRYKLTGLPGVSKFKQWDKIIRGCVEPKFVLDNWTTEDKLGETLYNACPDACILLLFDYLGDIAKRYRVAVRGEDGHHMMYRKMYRWISFDKYKKVRYMRVKNDGDYTEYTYDQFRHFMDTSLPTLEDMQFSKQKWIWEHAQKPQD